MPNPTPPPQRPGMRTGVQPRVDVEPNTHNEPPQPTSLPEFDDPGAITGIIPIATEGEDEAKNSDDSATTH